MILTGVTLVDVFATVKKPVKKIEQAYIDQLERNEVKRAEQEKAKPKEKAKTKFNVDVSLGPDVELPEHPVQATKPKTQKEEVAKEQNIVFEASTVVLANLNSHKIYPP